MAILRSLGKHEPAGLDFLVTEGLLPTNPPSVSYGWIVYGEEHGCRAEEEIIYTSDCVVWSQGGINRRVFKFTHEGEDVQQALLTCFPTKSTSSLAAASTKCFRSTPEDASGGEPQDTSETSPEKKQSRALVVLLHHQAQIFFLDGNTHTVNIPFDVERMFAAPKGIVLQRKIKALQPPTSPTPLSAPPNSFWSSQNHPFSSQPIANPFSELFQPPKSLATSRGSFSIVSAPRSAPPPQQELPTLFTLTDPVSELGLAVEGIDPSTSSTVTGLEPISQDEEILYVTPIDEINDASDHNDLPLVLIVTANKANHTYSLWHASYASAELAVGQAAPTTTHAATPLHRSRSKKRRSHAARMSTGAGTPALRGSDLHVDAGQGKQGQSSFEGGKPASQRLSESFMLDHDYDADFPTQDNLELMTRPGHNTRSTRRTSSMLARAELSSQDQHTFSDLARVPPAAGNSFGRYSRRPPSFGYGSLNKSRMSGRASTPGSTSFLSDVDESVNQELSRIDLVEDLLASAHLEASDRAAFRSTKGLKKELVLMRALTLPFAQASIPIANAVPPPEDGTYVVVLGPTLSCQETRHPPIRLYIAHPNKSVVSELLVPITHIEGLGSSSNQSRQMLVPTQPFSVHRYEGVNGITKVVDGQQARSLLLQNSNQGHCLYLLANANALATNTLEHQRRTSIALQYQQLCDVDCNPLKSPLMIGTGNTPLANASDAYCTLGKAGSFGRFSIANANHEHHRLQVYLRPQLADVEHLLALLQRSLSNVQRPAVDVFAVWMKVQALNEDKFTSEWESCVVLILVVVLGVAGQSRDMALRGISTLERPASTTTSNPSELADALEGEDTWAWCVEELRASKSINDDTGTSYFECCLHQARSIVCTAMESKDSFWEPLLTPDAAQEALVCTLAVLFTFVAEKQMRLDRAGKQKLGCVELLLLQLSHWFGLKPDLDRLGSTLQIPSPIETSTLLSIETVVAAMSWPRVYEELRSAEDINQHHLDKFLSLLGAGNNPIPEVWPVCPSVATTFDTLKSIVTSQLPEHGGSSVIDQLVQSASGVRLMETLPHSLAADFRNALLERRDIALVLRSDTGLALVGREDLKLLTDPSIARVETEYQSNEEASLRHPRDLQSLNHAEDHATISGHHQAMSSESLLRHIYRDDKRWSEAARLIDPVRVAVATVHPSPDQTESEVLEAQKEVAQKVYQRTMALPSGQAVMRFGINRPIMTEKIKINTFNTTCRIQPSNNSVNADKSNFTEEKVGWAFFHAGVSAGLQVARDAPGIDTSWLVLNKPNDLGNRHAGLLLGLGLNGHLKKMARWLAFKYLTSKHTMTSVGLLLGLSASNLGTQDSLVTRLISVHVTRLLPPGAAQLNISPLTQTAGIMGVGLLYYNTQHRRMTEVMLSELEHVDLEEPPPGIEGVKDESYRLAAGCSLGLINLGMGADLRALHDMGIVSRLQTVATGPRQIKSVHVLDQATAGAVLALAMIFMKTNDENIAGKVDALDAAHQFDAMRPDILLLRTVAKWIIMWDNIEPSLDWVERNSVKVAPNKVNILDSDNIPAYNIRAGLCWAIALKHAGSADQCAVHILRHHLHWVKRQLVAAKNAARLRKSTFDDSLTLDTLHRFQQLLALALATTCAGTGDLTVLRELRAMHGEIDNKTFGLHQATHMAIGMLFVGHGRYTLGTSNLAIAALLISLYPIFPRDVMDGRAHLQALRHLWVLAVEERCLLPRVAETGECVTIPIAITLKTPSSQSANPTSRTEKTPVTPSRRRRGKQPATNTSTEHEREVLKKEAPCHLPSLDTVASITTLSPEYFPVTLDFENNPAHLSAFKRHQSIFLQRRPLSAQFSSSFGATLAKQEIRNEEKSDALKAVKWIFDLDVFKKLGVDGVSEGVVNVSLGSERQGRRPVGTLIDGRVTAVDDILGLLADAENGTDENRLMWLRKLLEKESEQDGEGKRWLRREWVETVRAAVVERCRRQGGEGTGDDQRVREGEGAGDVEMAE